MNNITEKENRNLPEVVVKMKRMIKCDKNSFENDNIDPDAEFGYHVDYSVPDIENIRPENILNITLGELLNSFETLDKDVLSTKVNMMIKSGNKEIILNM